MCKPYDTMTEIHTDTYFDNIQLLKLVSSAEAIFKHIYDIVSTESKSFIDEWLCYKQEFDACSNEGFDKEFDIIVEGKDSNGNHWVTGDRSCSESTSSTDELDCDQELYSDYGSEFRETVDKYSIDFKKCTESITCKWFNYLNDNLMKDFSNKISTGRKQNLGNRTNMPQNHVSINDPNSNDGLLISASQQILYLRQMRRPLEHFCHNLVKSCTDKRGPVSRDLFHNQEIIEVIDTAIEMKSSVQTNYDLDEKNAKEYPVIYNCLKTLSVSELHYIFIVFFHKVVDLRTNSAPLDRLILTLDNVIVDRESYINFLKGQYIELRNSYLSLCAKKREYFLPSSIQKLENIDKESNTHQLRNYLRDLKEKEPEVAKERKLAILPLNAGIPNSNLRTLQRSVPSLALDARRQGNKLIIKRSENFNH